MPKQRSYEETHPWLTFRIDFRRAPAKLWAMLGECQSKCEHIANIPLRPATATALHTLFLAKGTLATTAIEGNTLSEEEVMRHLEGKLRLPPSREYLAREIDNIVEACDEIVRRVEAGEPLPLDRDRVKWLDGLVLKGLPVDEDTQPGVLRTHSVVVARYHGAPAKDCEYLLARLCEWIGGPDFAPEPGMRILNAIVKAVITHLYFAWIHPFGDGNGRTARLLEFQILVSSGVPSPAAHLLSNHYNQTRSEYYRQLDAASKSGGDVIPFLMYAVQGFLDGLRAQLDIILKQQLDVTWRNYVHERFQNRNTAAKVRQRHLLLDISARAEPVPMEEIASVSTRIARAYARKTQRTIARDINALKETGLLVIEGNTVRARKELILAFLPPRAAHGSISR